MISKAIVATVIALAITACGDYTGDTSYDNSGQDHSIDNSIDYGSGTVVVCNDSNCTSLATEEGQKRANDGNYTDVVTVGTAPRPDQSDASPATCAAAGLNYCPIVQDCTTPLDGGASACTGR